MDEIRLGEIPIPLIDYVRLIILGEPPYSDIVRHVIKEMEFHYQNTGKREIVYTINPRILTGEIKLLIQNNTKLTTINVCRTIQALFRGSKLREGEDFYKTTTASGGKNYHIRVNPKTLNACSRTLL